MLKMKNTKCIIDIRGENFVVNQVVYDYIRELERELDDAHIDIGNRNRNREITELTSKLDSGNLFELGTGFDVKITEFSNKKDTKPAEEK